VEAITSRTLEERILRVAEAALTEQRYVSAVDVLVGLGWLPWRRVDEWRQGRIAHLDDAMTVAPAKLSTVLASFRRWAEGRGLVPTETAYVARTRDRRALRFSARGEAEIERAYRTHWVSPELPPAKRERLAERQSRPPDLVVVSPLNDWTCTECGDSGDLLLMELRGRCACVAPTSTASSSSPPAMPR
jgi:hypothetical protein